MGLACRVPSGFRFFAAEQPYFAGEGMIFRRVREVEKAIRQLSLTKQSGRLVQTCRDLVAAELYIDAALRDAARSL